MIDQVTDIANACLQHKVANDAINGALELGAALLTLSSCRTLWRDKTVKGVNPWVTVYFLCWGVWNLFWYSSLNQPISYYAGMCITFTNTLWIGILLYFKYVEKYEQT